MKESLKAIINIPGWAQEFLDGSMTVDKVSTSGQSYSYVPLVYRAIRLRCDALSSVPAHIHTIGGDNQDDIDWMFDIPLSDLVWKTQAALLLDGAAFWLKGQNVMRGVKQLQFLNPFTVEVKYVNGQLVFKQQTESGSFGPWAEDQMVYFKEYNPTDDIGKGISPTAVSLADAQLLRYMTRFSGYFFEGGAMPVTLIGLDKSTPAAEVERVQGLFKQMLTGIKKAWSVIGIRSDVKPQILTPNLSDMAMPELYEQAMKNVGLAFGIPKSMLDDAANYATADADYMRFWQTSARPAGLLIQENVNRQLLNPMGLELVFGFDEMDVFQEDENSRAGSLAQLKNAGLPLKLAMELLGFDLTDDQWAMLDADEQRRDEASQAMQQSIANSRQTDTGDNNMDDLAKWEKKTIKRIKDGKPALCAFESEYIPVALSAAIAGALETVTDIDQVKAVFGDARRWEAYP